jgi:hypothetical protein
VVVVVVWAAVHSRQLHALRHQLLRTGQRARLLCHLKKGMNFASVTVLFQDKKVSDPTYSISEIAPKTT